MENKNENRLGAQALRSRPKKDKEKLNRSVNLKLTKADFNKVREKAEKLGIKATQFVREMVLRGGVKSRFTLEELDLMRKLSGMANNLNQIARRVNMNEFLQVGLDLVIIANRIKELLNDR